MAFAISPCQDAPNKAWPISRISEDVRVRFSGVCIGITYHGPMTPGVYFDRITATLDRASLGENAENDHQSQSDMTTWATIVTLLSRSVDLRQRRRRLRG